MSFGRRQSGYKTKPTSGLHEWVSLRDVTISNTCRWLACERNANQSHIGEQKVYVYSHNGKPRVIQNTLRQWDKRDLPLPVRRSFTEQQSSDLVRLRRAEFAAFWLPFLCSGLSAGCLSNEAGCLLCLARRALKTKSWLWRYRPVFVVVLYWNLK